MKSLLVSIFYPAWRLGCDPISKFICISYGDDLAHHHSVLTRKVMTSAMYQRIFPDTRLDKKAEHHIRTSRGGQRYATAVGSDITGFGADTIIVDDPMEPNDAGSESAKEKVRRWIGNSVLTRFNDQRKGSLLLVMHRVAPDDICATYEATGTFHVIKLPLVAEDDQEYYLDGPEERTLLLRRKGDLLNPGRWSADTVRDLCANFAPHVFASQYQQRPVPGGSGMLSVETFGRYDRDRSPVLECLIHSWDVGATINGNRSVLTCWGLRREVGDNVVYLRDVVRLQLELPEVLSAIKTRDRQDRPQLIILDERGVGLSLYQSLQRDGFRHLSRSSATKDAISREGLPGSRPSESKIDRCGRATLAIASGQVRIPNDAPWLEAFLYEVAAFPNIPDDDQVDSLTQLVANLEEAARRARMRRRPEVREFWLLFFEADGVAVFFYWKFERPRKFVDEYFTAADPVEHLILLDALAIVAKYVVYHHDVIDGFIQEANCLHRPAVRFHVLHDVFHNADDVLRRDVDATDSVALIGLRWALGRHNKRHGNDSDTDDPSSRPRMGIGTAAENPLPHVSTSSGKGWLERRRSSPAALTRSRPCRKPRERSGLDSRRCRAPRH